MAGGSLPTEISSFVGRRDDLAAMRRLLTSAHLLTVTGVGGVGKTRVSLRLAHELRRSFADGAWWADLSTLNRNADAQQVCETIAKGLGVHDHSTRTTLEVLIDHVRDRRLLLVLDNCEHLVDTVGDVVRAMLSVAPELRVIATSRQPLGIAGEHVVELRPLAAEAVNLLMDRVQAAMPDFTPSTGDRDTALRLCQRLEGLPLAIELAAAQLRSIGMATLLERLDDRFKLLNGLAAALDWSYQLCTEHQRLLWARLSVFAGDLDLAAAEQVCADDRLPREDVLAALAGLAEQSLLTSEHRAGRVRYRMLETIREYGTQRLDDPESVRQRHRDYFQRLAHDAATSWFGPDELRWLERIRAELPNVLASMDWSLRTPGESSAALDMAVSLLRSHCWYVVGGLAEGLRWLRISLASGEPQPTPLRAIGLAWASMTAVFLGDPTLSTELIADTGDDIADATTLQAKGIRAWIVEADNAAVVRNLTRARDLFERAGAHGDVFAADMWLAYNSGDGNAEANCRELVARAERLQAGYSLANATWAFGAHFVRRDPERAITLIEEALRRFQAIDDMWGCGWTMETLSWACAAAGHHDRAALLMGASAKLWSDIGLRLYEPGPFAMGHEAAAGLLRAALGERAFEAAIAEGAEIGFARAVAIGARVGRSMHSVAPASSDLTPREREVAELVAAGLTNPQIAAKLFLGARTVQTHLRSIMNKLGVNNRTQVAAHITRQGR
ncbi:LuxR C-terminal-related transcriptional regulator [Kutzneria sp. 744]|uniref:ATP-binding protein n=1 Tax=Kutzneria sp. (strain 744) TaxID=345341 RepID=UPI0003EED4B1|nr:LuxR C-terminal-related transcriptional regulator [Kutzneria sp. 744]EWM16350.1 protein kinase/ transcriptional regulator, LuxR family [Kutzneria sp. 744]